MGMKHRIYQEKLLLVIDILRLEEETLARQVFDEQLAQGYLGLALEAREICQEVGLPDVCEGKVSKGEVKATIAAHHLATLKEEMEGKKKCASLLQSDLTQPQPYSGSKCLAQARMGFRIQNKMVVCPGNMGNKFRGKMECEACVAWRGEGRGSRRWPHRNTSRSARPTSATGSAETWRDPLAT